MITKFAEEKEFLDKAIHEAYSLYLKKGFQVRQKAAFDLVTDVDTSIESYLVRKINEAYPHDRIMAEEGSPAERSCGRTWIIDPIDGTVNMTRGIPLFGTQVAIADGPNPVFGYMRLPFINATICAELGGGAYINGEAAKPRGLPDMQNAIVSIGDYTHRHLDIQSRQLHSVAELIKHVAKIRMFGSAAVDFAFASLGLTDGTMVITSNAWDLAPGLLIAKEAGLIVTNPEGREFKIGDGGAIAAFDVELHSLMVKSFSK